MTDTGATLPPPHADHGTGGEADHASDTATASQSGSTLILTRPPRSGELTSGWRIVTACCWIGVVASFAAVWNTSERLGLSTWWLGPRGEPMPMVVRLSPFMAPTLMVLAAANNVRWLWRWGVVASLVTAAVAIGDVGGFSRLAGVELAVAAAALVVSLASVTGTYRPAPESIETVEAGDGG